MQVYIDKVKNILEALPYITEFSDKIIVVKYGGAAMVNEKLKASFATDITLLKYLGIHPVIVHGGGPFISEALKTMKIETEFIQGHRKTTRKTMEVVEMVLSAKINKEIVTLINSKNGNAVGISGRDAKMAIGKIYYPEITRTDGSKEFIDIGLVGKIQTMNTSIVHSLLKDGFIPVISPISETPDGIPLNINADIFAGALASALQSEKLILLTDTKGIIIDDVPQSHMKKVDVEKYIQTGEISGGMIPKVECCLKAIEQGTHKAHIIDGRVEHSVLLELLTDQGVGTLMEA